MTSDKMCPIRYPHDFDDSPCKLCHPEKSLVDELKEAIDLDPMDLIGKNENIKE